MPEARVCPKCGLPLKEVHDIDGTVFGRFVVGCPYGHLWYEHRNSHGLLILEELDDAALKRLKEDFVLD